MTHSDVIQTIVRRTKNHRKTHSRETEISSSNLLVSISEEVGGGLNIGNGRKHPKFLSQKHFMNVEGNLASFSILAPWMLE